MAKGNKAKLVTADERTVQKTSKAAVITLCVVWIGVLIYAVYKAFRYGIGSITEELVILCGSLLVFLCAQFNRHDVDLPKSLNGRALPVGTDKHSRLSRLGNYLAEGAVDAVIVSAINIGLLKVKPTYTLTRFITLSTTSATLVANFIIDLAVLFVVFSAIAFAAGEHNVRKYNAQTKEEEEFDSKLK